MSIAGWWCMRAGRSYQTRARCMTTPWQEADWGCLCSLRNTSSSPTSDMSAEVRYPCQTFVLTAEKQRRRAQIRPLSVSNSYLIDSTIQDYILFTSGSNHISFPSYCCKKIFLVICDFFFLISLFRQLNNLPGICIGFCKPR